MANEEHHALLLTSFKARVLAETDTECDEHWTAMKEEWSGRGGMQYPKRLALSHIFDRVEA
eukprot:642895-Rhodomonas_salina.1